MTKFLIKCFIKDYQNIDKSEIRSAYGIFSCIVGIICNVLLCVAKLIIGTLLHSVSIMADAMNNLSDTASSVIGLIGIKVAEKPADKEHPFGHGRMEYIVALIVAFLVIQVGFSFLTNAFSRILHPEEMKTNTISLIILIISMGMKLWLSIFYKTLGKRIQSQVMLATGADAAGDVLITGATIFSLLVFQIAKINIDGYVGVAVAGFVIWSGISIAKETIEPLIGKALDPKLYLDIKEIISAYPWIEGTHDLIVHNYGANNSMATIHVEVSEKLGLAELHEVIDKIERETMEKLGIELVIHIDPIVTTDKEVLEAKKVVEDVVQGMGYDVSIHDFRMTKKGTQAGNKKLIFDMVVPHSCTQKEQEELCAELTREVQCHDSKYQCVITIDKSYIAEEDVKKDV